jgi:hypothetical protein
MPPIKASFWTTSYKIETNMFPFFHLFNLYTLELNCGQTIWDKTKVLLVTSWGTHLGIFWKLDGNVLGRRGKHKNASPLPHQKEKEKLDH